MRKPPERNIKRAVERDTKHPAKSAGKPGAKHPSKHAVKPVAKPTVKPVAKPMAKPVAKPADERVAAPVTVTFDAFAIASPGFAPLLADELRALDIRIGEVSPAGVAFVATAESLMHVNLWSRLATRVIVRLAQFTARDFATLEKQAARVPWSRVVSPGALVRFRVTCKKSRLYHSDAVAERVARGVSGAVKSVTVLDRSRGEEDTDDLEAIEPAESRAEQLIIVRFEHDVCTISADSSGDLLHRRGWRQAVAKAPLRETLAAAMLAACEWNGEVPLVDPFCGSGTIGIEAALRARGMAPGLGRAFAMERWPRADAAQIAKQRAVAVAAAKPSVGVRIVMSDRDAGACAAARANAERAGVAGDIEIVPRPLSDVSLASVGDAGLVLSNPPYGMRVSDGADMRNLYARLGDVVREGGRGWQLALLIPDKRLIASAKLASETVLRTTNGGIGVTLERSRLLVQQRSTAKAL